MKRTVEFNKTEKDYEFCEKNIPVFKINIKDLKVDARDLYNTFFAKDMDYHDISFINNVSDDTKASRVFECIKNLVDEVCEALIKSENEQNSNNTHTADKMGNLKVNLHTGTQKPSGQCEIFSVN